MKFNVVFFVVSMIGCVFAANFLNKGSFLKIGSELKSNDGLHRAVFQLDGNFVVFQKFLGFK